MADDSDIKRPSRYRKVEVRTWGDERFRALTPIPPCGQGLWLFLITGPHTSPIPGLFRAGRASMAEELGWEVEDFDEAFREAFQQGMVKADFKARLVWVPKGIKHNRPESPNVVKSWAAEFDLLPECDLKREAFESLKQAICSMGDGFAKAFRESFGKPSDKPTRKPSAKPSVKAIANQEQEQEQEQKQEQEQEQKGVATGSSAPDAPPAGDIAQQSLIESPAGPPAPPAQRPPRRPADHTADPKPSVAAWNAYSVAYQRRYREEPVRNAKVNGQMANFVSRVPADEAPHIATFYVGLADPFYVRQMHAVDYLVRDAEKLRTQWATSRRADAGQRPGRDFETEQRNAEAKRMLGFHASRTDDTVIEG